MLTPTFDSCIKGAKENIRVQGVKVSRVPVKRTAIWNF